MAYCTPTRSYVPVDTGNSQEPVCSDTTKFLYKTPVTLKKQPMADRFWGKTGNSQQSLAIVMADIDLFFCRPTSFVSIGSWFFLHRWPVSSLETVIWIVRRAILDHCPTIGRQIMLNIYCLSVVKQWPGKRHFSSVNWSMPTWVQINIQYAAIAKLLM